MTHRAAEGSRRTLRTLTAVLLGLGAYVGFWYSYVMLELRIQSLGLPSSLGEGRFADWLYSQARIEHVQWLFVFPAATILVALLSKKLGFGWAPATAILVSPVIWMRLSMNGWLSELMVSLTIQVLAYSRIVRMEPPGFGFLQKLIGSRQLGSQTRSMVRLALGVTIAWVLYSFLHGIYLQCIHHYLLIPVPESPQAPEYVVWSRKLENLDYIVWLVVAPIAMLGTAMGAKALKLGWLPCTFGVLYTAVIWGQSGLNSWWQELLPSVALQLAVLWLVAEAPLRKIGERPPAPGPCISAGHDEVTKLD